MSTYETLVGTLNGSLCPFNLVLKVLKFHILLFISQTSVSYVQIQKVSISNRCTHLRRVWPYPPRPIQHGTRNIGWSPCLCKDNSSLLDFILLCCCYQTSTSSYAEIQKNVHNRCTHVRGCYHTHHPDEKEPPPYNSRMLPCTIIWTPPHPRVRGPASRSNPRKGATLSNKMKRKNIRKGGGGEEAAATSDHLQPTLGLSECSWSLA